MKILEVKINTATSLSVFGKNKILKWVLNLIAYAVKVIHVKICERSMRKFRKQ